MDFKPLLFKTKISESSTSSPEIEDIQFRGSKPELNSTVDTSSAPVAAVLRNDEETTSIDEISDEILGSTRTSTPHPVQAQPVLKDIAVEINCWGVSYEAHSTASSRTPCCIFCCCICC